MIRVPQVEGRRCRISSGLPGKAIPIPRVLRCPQPNEVVVMLLHPIQIGDIIESAAIAPIYGVVGGAVEIHSRKAAIQEVVPSVRAGQIDRLARVVRKITGVGGARSQDSVNWSCLHRIKSQQENSEQNTYRPRPDTNTAISS